MFLVVGLGNPGYIYKNTRHNLGAKVVENLADQLKIKFSQHQCFSLIGQRKIKDEKIILAKPQLYMNESGQAVASLVKKYKLKLDYLILVLDDFNLTLGRLRIRKGGRSGGHNGLTAVIQSLGSQDFIRVRIGVGQPPRGMDPANYVLGRFTSKENKTIKQTTDKAAQAIMALINCGLETAMNQYNAPVMDNV